MMALGSMGYPDDDGVVHARMFQCRDGLWDTFAEIARDQGVAIDALLDEAMVAYARSRGRELGMQAAPPRRREPDNLDETMDRASMGGGTAPPPPVRMPAPPQRTVSRPGTNPVGMHPPNPVAPVKKQPTARMPPGLGQSGTSRVPPPLPPGISGSVPHTQRLGDAPRTATLVLTYNGQTYTVDKDRYLLGRSKTQADLRLDDSNVSRQHAMIERVSNAWYVVDLGSTNGVYVDGERVARRAVRDGDVIEITTHRIECRIR
jgi:hypothetical protein